MMWLYDLSLEWQFVLIVAVFVFVGVGGALAFRRSMHRSVSQVHLHNDLVGFFLSALGVFYGLLMGLVAVAAWEMHEDAETLVTREATAVAALYRDVSVYPEPGRSQLQGMLKEYVRFVIEEAWPIQRYGIVSDGGYRRVSVLEQGLVRLEPATPGQTIVHQEAMRQFNVFVEARQQRLEAVKSGLPATLWCVMILGGAIVLAVSWMFVFSELATQLILTAGLAGIIGALVFLSVAMDRPFHGPKGIGPEPYELVRGQITGQ